MARIYGYFDDPASDKPTYDPGLDVPCPMCGKMLISPVVTVSLMLYDADDRSYFYRMHKDCHDALTEQQRTDLDSLLIDALGQARNVN